MPSVSWGTPYTLAEYKLVGENDEIPLGSMLYVQNSTTRDYDDVTKIDWDTFISGDLTELKNRIENDIQGTTVRYIKVSWVSNEVVAPIPTVRVMRVVGFKVEALVENTHGAGLTGLEIVAIIMAIAFLAAVVGFIALGAWLVYEVMKAAGGLGPIVGPAATIGVGMIIFIVIIFAVLILFGAKAKGSKKGVSFGK